VLVAGATGQLGGVIARKLLAAGTRVRALARDAGRLSTLAQAGAEPVPVNLLDLPALTEACRGVRQIIATANNNMGRGAVSPGKVDVPAYQNLCAAARNAGVRRLIYVSYRGVSRDAPVDIFRIKWYVEDAIRRSGLPHVMLRPTAFMDVWIDSVLLPDIKRKGAATIFGDGTRVSNYIAVDDVAEFAVRVLAREEIVNEAIDLGGPSNVSLNEVAALLERHFGVTGRRRHLPVWLMRVLPPMVRPFNEVTARLMTLGLYAAAHAEPFPGWKASSDRFGVRPVTIEDYVARLNK
jgi:NADH dehydrogenase